MPYTPPEPQPVTRLRVGRHDATVSGYCSCQVRRKRRCDHVVIATGYARAEPPQVSTLTAALLLSARRGEIVGAVQAARLLHALPAHASAAAHKSLRQEGLRFVTDIDAVVRMLGNGSLEEKARTYAAAPKVWQGAAGPAWAADLAESVQRAAREHEAGDPVQIPVREADVPYAVWRAKLAPSPKFVLGLGTAIAVHLIARANAQVTSLYVAGDPDTWGLLTLSSRAASYPALDDALYRCEVPADPVWPEPSPLLRAERADHGFVGLRRALAVDVRRPAIGYDITEGPWWVSAVGRAFTDKVPDPLWRGALVADIVDHPEWADSAGFTRKNVAKLLP